MTSAPGIINLTSETFKEDALIFKNLKSENVALKTENETYSVNVRIIDWPYLGIWAKASAPFVCIEPWQGIADYDNFSGPVESKEGILILEPGKKLNKSFEMTFTP